MVDFKRIGFATDFSKTSGFAQAYVKKLRNTFHAELFVIHAFNDRDLAVPEPYYFMPGVDKWLIERQDEAKTLAKEAVEKLATDLGNAHAVFLEGKPPQSLVEFAKTAELDLLVMGTHGYHGFSRFMLGSVAEHVLRHAPCPVLTVKKPEDAEETEDAT